MLHTDEKKATFHYFASTMRKNNSDTENILYSMENGLPPPPQKKNLNCTVSCLKKHVKDNIRTKMLALGIQNKSKLLGNS